MKIKCVVCEKICGESHGEVIETNADFLVLLGFCPDHEPATEPEPERGIEAEFEEANLRILSSLDIIDESGNAVKIIVRQ